MHLAETTWTDADATETDLAVLPVGSTEQHGPHAPLGTDYLTAEHVASEGAAHCEKDVVVGPPVPVGVSEEHRQFTGTLWVSPDTFRSYVRETVESLLSHGWDRVVIVNGHGGNTAAIREIASELTRRFRAVVAPYTWFDAVDVDLDMGHAGAVETSLLLRTYPELLHEGRFEAAAADGAQRWGDWVSGVNLSPDTASFTDNGAVGDPTEASTESGAALETQAVDALATLLEAVSRRSLETPPHK
ncbi:MAG: creatininase family protein [Halanaeroarchaeum sp.]